MIKQENLLIKKKSNGKYLLFFKNNCVGNLLLNIKNNDYYIKIKTSKENLNNSFFKMFTNYLFKNKNVANIVYDNKTITSSSFYFMDKYDILLFDIDDTILSFSKAEKKALTLALNKVNVIAKEDILNTYHQINMKYWQKVEKNEISRDECLILRFKEFLPLYNIDYDAILFEDLYRYYLNKQSFVMKNARKVLSILEKNYRIYAITNGVKQTQQYRIKKSKMDVFFLKSFISEEIGFNKPSIAFFNNVKENIENLDLSKCLIIGDSLTSDIKLGINNNVDTCWFNFNYLDNNTDIKPTYTINSLLELIY